MNTEKVTLKVVNAGLTYGTVLGIVISWSVNKSIFWALLHGFFGWFYVIYFAINA